MELAAAASSRRRARSLTHARQQGLPRQDYRRFGEDVDFLFDVAIEMEPEDGLIWVHGLDDDSVMAFTDDGVDSLVELIKICREMTPREKRGPHPGEPPPGACAGRLP